MENKTLGESRVRTTFNPSDNSTVQSIKEMGAAMINACNDNLQPKDDWDTQQKGEFFRLKALALTAIEEGTMWAVKAATA